MEEPPFFKFLLLGSYGVGKTQITRALLGESFQKEYFPTFGLDFRRKIIRFEKRKFELEIIEVGCLLGNRFPGIEKVIRDVDAILIIYDVTNKWTLEEGKKQFISFVEKQNINVSKTEEAQKKNTKKAGQKTQQSQPDLISDYSNGNTTKLIIVGNKNDTKDSTFAYEQKITSDDLNKVFKGYVYTSHIITAKKPKQVKKIFTETLSDIDEKKLENIIEIKNTNPGVPGVSGEDVEKSDNNKCCIIF